ncbi:MAG: STT3 domain-containing protein, partial [bacterium]
MIWAVLAGAFLLRVVPYVPSVFHEGHVDITDPDAAYHARRILQGAETFPILPVFDPDQNAPYGALSVWSPGYDWVMAGAARLLMSAAADESRVLAILAWIPPILGTLALWCMYRVTRRLLPEGWAVLAVALAGALPRGIFYTSLGNVDHHAAEALALMGTGLAWCRLAESG